MRDVTRDWRFGSGRLTGWRGRLGWLASGGLTLANPFFHKSVSDVCDWASARWGFSLYDRIALIGIPVASVAVVSGVLWRGRALQRPGPRALAGSFLLAALTIACQQWLFVANVELIHFPQYALLSGALLAAGLS